MRFLELFKLYVKTKKDVFSYLHILTGPSSFKNIFGKCGKLLIEPQLEEHS